MDAADFPTLDPDLAGLLQLLPDTRDVLDDVEGARAMMLALAAGSGEVDTTGLVVEDVPLTAFGSPASARVYRPVDAGPDGDRGLAGVLHLHGGGFCLGSVDLEHAVSVDLARTLGVVVVAVDYRLAPEHPYPAPVEDCYAGLQLLASLDGVDATRLAVHGSSAGGGLSASVALLARDRGGPAVCFQSLDIPVLDDRLETPSMRAGDGTPMWSRPQARTSWEYYLGGAEADHYAAPMRAESVAGLPPAYVVVCELDPLRDEGIAYASRLLQAGVSVELHCVPGAFHGMAIVQDAPVVQRMRTELHTVLRRALA